MIAGDQRNSFVVAEFSEKRNHLRGIGNLFAAEIAVEHVHQFRSFQRLIFARQIDLEHPDILIAELAVFVRQRARVSILRPVEFRFARASVLRDFERDVAEMRIIFFVLIIRGRIKKIERREQALNSLERGGRNLDRIGDHFVRHVFDERDRTLSRFVVFDMNFRNRKAGTRKFVK